MQSASFQEAMARAMELPVDRFDVPGTTVVLGEDRRGERLVSHYRVGRHSVIWVDPELVDELAEWHGRPEAQSFNAFRDWATRHGGEALGCGLEHLLAGTYDEPPRPDQVRVLEGADGEVIELASEMLQACSADDRDEADFDLAALDRHLVGWIDDGRLLALAGGRRWALRPGHLDVGVLVHPAHRRAGRGRAVIAALVGEVLRIGETPLYRCRAANIGSQRLCRGLGFEVALELEGFRWAPA